MNTYSTLQEAIANWLDRGDLADAVPNFITLAEAYFNRVFRVREQESVSSSVMDSGTIDLPDNWLEFRTIYLAEDPTRPLETVSEDTSILQDGRGSGVPYGYTIKGTKVYFHPMPDSDYDVGYTYYQSIPALSDTLTTNWLLTAHPDIYLYGALVAAEPFLKNDERILVWKSLRDEAISEITDLEKYSGSTLRMRAS